MRHNHRSAASIIAVFVFAALATTPQTVLADENCCFNNYRFAGGCMVVARGSETCQSILAYLNNFNAVGSYYCDNTTVRGGWTLTDCSNPSQLAPKNLTPQTIEPAAPAQQQLRGISPVQPETAPAARDATLIQTAMPLKVRVDSTVDSGAGNAGQLVTGHLEQALMSGDTVIAPAGSQVLFRLVPTSYWTNGGGDAFRIHATGIKVGERVIPISATAVQTEGEATITGSQVKIAKGTLVSFETAPAAKPDDVKAVLEAGTNSWMKAFDAHDADTLASLYAEDAVLLPPNAPAVFGRDAIRASNQELFANQDVGMELEDLEIKVAGDIAYKAGRYRMFAKNGGLLDRGKYIEIWTKTNDGWLIHRDIWNSSLPAANEGEAAAE